MTNHISSATTQLGFDTLIADADRANIVRRVDAAWRHLPGACDEALPFYRALLERHHVAMLAADVEGTMRLREEAHNLALKLNGGDSGVLANDDSPGYVLARETAAVRDAVPLWGQSGAFVVEIGGMRVRIETDGMFGIGSTFCYWPGFSAHAVDFHRPFLSEAGYRSFLGIHASAQPGLTPDSFAREILAAYVARELKGKLRTITKR